jgi:Cof subfamily protein (haloacid dehalogenase superfamily)
MIRAIIIDVDGVIIGEKKGFNFPEPHPKVIARLRAIKHAGIPISLCTAKPHYAVQKIIDDAGLDNVHITLAGGVVIDPIDNVVLQKNILPNDIAQRITQMYLANDVYMEVYSVDNYFVQASQLAEVTDLHTETMQRKPIVVDSLLSTMAQQEVVKVLPIAKDEADKARLAQLFKPYANDLTLSWATHPFIEPYVFGNITAKGISKKHAVSIVADILKIQTEDILGVGDSVADWQFIELCGYGAAMGNAATELKQLVDTKGSHGYIGASVNDNGILDIFEHFKV